MQLFKSFKSEILISLIISVFIGFFLYKNYNFPKTYTYEITFNDTINSKNFKDINNIEIFENIINFKDFVYSYQSLETKNKNLFQFPDLNEIKWVKNKVPSMNTDDYRTFEELHKIIFNYNKLNKIFDSIIFISDKNFPKHLFYKVRLIKYKPNREKIFYDEQITIIFELILEHLNNELIFLLEERINNFVSIAIFNGDQNIYEKELKDKILILKKELFQELKNLKLSSIDDLITYSEQTSSKYLVFNNALLTVIIFLFLIFLKRFFKIDKRSN